MASAADIQAQIAQITAQLTGSWNPEPGTQAATQRDLLSNQLFELQNNALPQAQAQAQQSTSNGQVQANRDAYHQDASQAVANYTSDPTTQLVSNYLKQQMGGQIVDPSKMPFQNGAPSYGASQAGAASYQGGQMGASSYNPSTMMASTIGGGTPYDATTINAMMTQQGQAAAGGEAASNQMLMDTLAANGGNANDPSLRAAMQENLTNRNNMVSNARLGIDTQANLANFNANRQADLANQAANMQTSTNNMQAQNQAGQYNAGNQQAAATNNLASQNQANQFNAGTQQQSNLANQNANNSASQFNIGNQMTASNANYNAGVNAAQINANGRMTAANNLSASNNQRLGGLNVALGNQQQMYQNEGIPTGGAPQSSGMIMPSSVNVQPFQLPSYTQYQQQAAPAAAPSYSAAPQSTGNSNSSASGSSDGYATFAPAQGAPVADFASIFGQPKPQTTPAYSGAMKRPMNPDDPYNMNSASGN